MNKKPNIFQKISGIFLSIICGFLGALSGAEHSCKFFRRFLVPLCLSGFSFWRSESILDLLIITMSFAFSLGYGMPCPDDPKPSVLGKFWYGIFNSNYYWANIFTRLTIGCLVCLSLISIPLIRKNFLTYAIGCAIILLSYGLLSWRSLGSYTIFNRQLLVSETLIYSIIATVTVLLNLL